MATNSNGGPCKTRHLNDIAVCCEALGIRVICVDAAERDFWLSATLACASALEGKARISQGLLVLKRERGHRMFPGKPGSGMSITEGQMSRIFLAKSDVSRVRELYSGDDGERLAETIRENCYVWYLWKQGDAHHDK